jgi:hypothetical protein
VSGKFRAKLWLWGNRVGNSKLLVIFYWTRVVPLPRLLKAGGWRRIWLRPGRWRYLFLLVLFIFLTGGLPPSRAAVIWPKLASPAHLIWAQGDNDFSVANVSGQAGVPLPVRVFVGPALLSPDDDRDEPAVIFSGLLAGCRLSAGSKRTRSWYVPLDKLEGLMLIPQAGCEGDFSVLVMIYDGKDVRNDTATILFSIHAGTSVRPSMRSPAQPEVRTAPAMAPAEEEVLLKKGALLLKNGDVSAARLCFENLALRGSAKGAYALAQSFDPAVLRSMKIAGLRPDLTKAKEWYAKASALGDQEAAQRLNGLSPAQ